MAETTFDLSDPGAVRALFDGITSPDELRDILDAPGADDAAIDEFIGIVGTEQFLDRVFDLMCAHFAGERAGGESGVVQWNVKARGDKHPYHLEVRDGTAVRHTGPAASPRVTLTVTAPDLLRVCAGKLAGVQAVMTGKMKLSGDMMWGAKLPGWFNI
ncbi:SCP2 sterol-binding domain-containing protein [Actinomadura flavalba]|uniref:SCP2 sterol-binding domain-containing protein n=1 Tax=Actinomadura flavalba TaxID=1120938 RepID=UPI0003777AB9|nr:SCP2 sterol-binding domain-containing protein [Actinomadura flavalba]